MTQAIIRPFPGTRRYDNVDALLDGALDDETWFQVGAIRTYDGGLKGPSDPDAELCVGGACAPQTRVELKARPNEYYFEPHCVSCEACYDANGHWRAAPLENGTSGAPWRLRGWGTYSTPEADR